MFIITVKRCALAAICWLAFGCGSKSERDDHVSTQVPSVPQTVTTRADSVAEGSVTADDAIDFAECPIGAAEPIVKRSIYPNASFQLNNDNRTGSEVVNLETGDKLAIRHWGCEYFILTFRFETSRFLGDTTDTRFWFDKALLLMTEIQDKIDAPLNIKEGTEITSAYVKHMNAYLLGEEVVYDTGDIRDFVTLDRIQKIDESRFAIDISYASGPY